MMTIVARGGDSTEPKTHMARIASMLQGFENRLTAIGRSQATISAYVRDAEIALVRLNELFPLRKIHEVRGSDIDAILAHKSTRILASGVGRSPLSLHRFKAAIRAFFNWANEAGICERNPTSNVRFKRIC